MQPKTAFTFVLSNQKPSELPKAAVQHFLHHCCLIPAPTHPLSHVSTRSIPGKQLPCPSSRRSCSMPVLVAPDFRVPHPSSASFEHSLHSFCLPHIYPAQSSPSNFVCLWLAPFCVPQHHIWLPKMILTFFFFFFSWMYLPLGASQQSCVLPGMSLLGQNILHDLSELIWLFFSLG